MPIILVDGKATYVDFAEYERSRETFADIEYQKWLALRDRKKSDDEKSKENKS